MSFFKGKTQVAWDVYVHEVKIKKLILLLEKKKKKIPGLQIETV